jgi:hypothetical protein
MRWALMFEMGGAAIALKKEYAAVVFRASQVASPWPIFSR